MNDQDREDFEALYLTKDKSVYLRRSTADGVLESMYYLRSVQRAWELCKESLSHERAKQAAKDAEIAAVFAEWAKTYHENGKPSAFDKLRAILERK